MKRTFTCIVCPNGCEIETEYEGTQVLSVTGNLCPKGKTYVTQELVDPRRTIATSVRVLNGTMPLTSVRLTNAVPKDRIFDVMDEINRQTLTAPVRIGDVVIANVLGLGSDVIVTKNIDKA
jgi:CxxC motif-containing protein